MSNDANSSALSTEAWEDYLIGGIFLATIVIVFILYTPCLIAMVRNKELWKSSCIRIMFNMGIADLVNACTQGIYAICTILRLKHTLPLSVNEHVGNVLEAFSWFPVVTFINILGLNRLLIFVSSKSAMKLFSPVATYAWLALGWGYGVLWYIYLLAPQQGMMYHFSMWVAYFDMSKSGSATAVLLAAWNSYIQFSISSVLYVLLIFALRKKNTKMSDAYQAEARRREVSLSIQATLIVGFYLIAALYFLHSQKFVFLAQWRYSHALGNWIWIATAAINPIIYLSLNKTIRSSVLSLLGFNKTSSAPKPTQQNERNTRQTSLLIPRRDSMRRYKANTSLSSA